MKRIVVPLVLVLIAVSGVAIWFSSGSKVSLPDAAVEKSIAATPQRAATPQATKASAATESPAARSTTPPKTTAGTAATRASASAFATSPARSVPTAQYSSPSPVQASGKLYPPMSLADVLGPNRLFHDDVFGVSLTYPDGWIVRQAARWGTDNEQNTVWFQPPDGNHAQPSMYYQKYPDGAPAPGNAEAMLRDMAQQKEESRQQGAPDYKNDPDSFVFREIDGHPALSYFATYSQGNQVRAEYFMRILGPTGYVMFFVRGPVNDVQSLIPSVYQAGSTVRPP